MIDPCRCYAKVASDEGPWNRFAICLCAAFAQKVTVEFDQAADFTKYKTFAIRDSQLNSKNASLNSELVKKRIDADITSDLTAKGLTLVSQGPSDLNVRYVLGSAGGSRSNPIPQDGGASGLDW